MDTKRLQNPTYFTRWGVLQGIHQMLIFPPTRVHHNKQNHLIKRVKRFQDGKWEELWKQSLHEYEIEKAYIQPPREKSTDQKVRTSDH